MAGSYVLKLGLNEVIRQAVPSWFVPVVIGITHLGNVVFLLALFTADYWFGNHKRGAHALSLALAGMAIITTLKAIFAEPRPPEPSRLIAASGYSFPSGHATIATIGYGALAYDLKLKTWRTRYTVAGILIVLVALSRVALGVHFLRDVVAGIAVGLIFLAVAEALTGHDPRPGFLLGVVLGVCAVVVSGISQDSMAEFGAILGAGVAWETFHPIPTLESRQEQLILLVGGLPIFIAISYLSLFRDFSLIVVFLLNMVLLAGVILAPIPVTQLLGRD